jgi:hypothetical protein
MTRRCLRCKKNIIKSHFNRKRCEPCAAYLVKRPQGTMSQAQKTKALSLIGKMPRDKIAEKLGVSVSDLKRSMKGVSLWFHNGKYVNRPDLVKKIIHYYKTHTLDETIKKFNKNGVSVKSIIDRPEYYNFKKHEKIIPWTGDQIVEAVKMNGLISYKSQAAFFNRPGANEGSIKSLLTKRFDKATGLNGMTKFNAVQIANKSAKYLKPYGNGRNGKPTKFINLILWVDLERNLKLGVPESIKRGVESMADFQRWIWKSKNPKPLILKMIKEREIAP